METSPDCPDANPIVITDGPRSRIDGWRMRAVGTTKKYMLVHVLFFFALVYAGKWRGLEKVTEKTRTKKERRGL